MAYHFDNGYKRCNNKSHFRKSCRETNCNLIPCLAEAIRAYRARNELHNSPKYCCNISNPHPCSCSCRCNCYCCSNCNCRRRESHKFIDYADASLSSSSLTKCICTKANVSVQPSKAYCACTSETSKIVEPMNNNLHMTNNYPIDQQVPIMSTCIKRTEICKSVCPAARCFNFEKQIELNQCEKNVNINVEVKVKKKKKKCKCKRDSNEEHLMKPCVCFKDPDEEEKFVNKCDTRKSCIVSCPYQNEQVKKCSCNKAEPVICITAKNEPCCEIPKPITLCCPPRQSPDKSKIFNILKQFRKTCDCKTEDLNQNESDEKDLFLCTAKPLTPKDFSSMMEGIKLCCKPNCSSKNQSASPIVCLAKHPKKKRENSRKSKDNSNRMSSDVTLEMLKSSSSNRKHSSTR